MDFVYVMEECGCRITEDGLVTWSGKTEKGSETRRRVCIKHGTRISHRVSNCIDCGIEIRQHKSGEMSLMCDKCKTEVDLEKNRLKASKYRLAAKAVSDCPEGTENHGCPMFHHVCKVCIDQLFPCAVSQSKQSQAAA